MATPPVPGTIDELWRDAHRWIAVETMLFETLGAAARSADTPLAARRVLGAWSNRHAWHADLWRARVPVIPNREFLPDDFGWAESTRAAIEADLGALVETVLPAVREHVADHRRNTDDVLDGPTARILTLVAADVDAELSELAATLG